MLDDASVGDFPRGFQPIPNFQREPKDGLHQTSPRITLFSLVVPQKVRHVLKICQVLDEDRDLGTPASCVYVCESFLLRRRLQDIDTRRFLP